MRGRGERKWGRAETEKRKQVDQEPESKRPREHMTETAGFYRKEKLREGKQSPGPGLRGLVGGRRSKNHQALS